MQDGMEEHRQAVALFRYEVLAPVLNEPPDRAAAVIRAQAGKAWEIPGSRRIRVAEGTIYGWLRLYRERGFEGLLPKKPQRPREAAADAAGCGRSGCCRSRRTLPS